MKYRVKIKQAPKYNVRVRMPEAKTGMQVDGSLYNELASFGGADQCLTGLLGLVKYDSTQGK